MNEKRMFVRRFNILAISTVMLVLGTNLAQAQTFNWPVSGPISEGGDYSAYGPITNPTTGILAYKYHTGIDIATTNPSNPPEVFASADGEICGIRYDSDPNHGGWWGNAIVLKHGDVYTLYAHLSNDFDKKKITFKEKFPRDGNNSVIGRTIQSVDKNMKLGIMGNTGYTIGQTGIHLHFEIKKLLDPNDPWGPGYIVDLPDGYKYKDPRFYIVPFTDTETNITPVIVKVNPTVRLLNVRSGPGKTDSQLTTYASLTQIQTNQKFVAYKQRVDKQGNVWYKVYLPNANGAVSDADEVVSGWCSKSWGGESLLSEDYSTGQILVTKTGGIDLYTDAGTTVPTAVKTINGYVNLKIWNGQRFAVSDQKDIDGCRWYKIYLPTLANQSFGWVSKKDANNQVQVQYFPGQSGQTLSASLTVNTSSGTAPLKGVDFTATVSGNATGTINYTFYADRSDSGIDITPGYCFKIDGRSPDGKGGTVVYQGSATNWSGGTTFTVYNVCNYLTPGTYTAKVIAERGSASPAEARVIMTVSGSTVPPKAQFSANTISGNAPLTVQFTDQSTGNITSYSWNFGDGGTSIAQNPAHTYTTAGNYAVSLTVTGPDGSDTKTKTGYIQVNTPPLPPDFTFESLTPATQTIVQGESTSYVIFLKSISGYNLPVYLSVTGISPSSGNNNSITCSLSSSLVTPSDPPATTTLNVVTLQTVIPQTYTISIRGQDGTKIHDASVQLVVNPSSLTGSISGKVYVEETGILLDGVGIEVREQFDRLAGYMTTVSGAYKMEGLTPSSYYTRGKLPGYGTALRTDIPVNSGREIQNQDLFLTNNPGWIYGTVKDTNNNALGNIYVSAHIRLPRSTDNTFWVSGANTASNTGNYELRDLGAGNNYQVRTNGVTINNMDYAALPVSNVSVQKGQGTNINLILQQAAKIYGSVKDAQGNPVKGVRISCWADNGNIGGNGDTTTDGNGNYKDYSLKYLLPGYTYTVDVIPLPDTDYVVQRFQVNVPSAGNYERNITLEGGAIKISGNVKVKATQQPPQDTAVEIGYWNRQYSVWKSVYVNRQDGSYILTNLPKGGEVEISVRPESVYACDGMTRDFQQDEVINFELVPEAIIFGVIKDFDTGLPVTASLDIGYTNEEKGVGNRVFTNPADGTFSLTGLPSGLVGVTVMPQTETGYAWKWAYFYLSEGEHKTSIELLVKKGALVSGSLKDTAGTGIPNQEILINGSGGGEIQVYGGGETRVYSDYMGNFQARVSPGNYVATLVDTDMRDWTVIPLEFTITDPADNKTIELIGYNPSNANYINGEVVNTGGYPKTSAFMVVALKAGRVWNKETIRNPEFVSIATLDNAGPYQLMVPPGHTYDLYLVVFDRKVGKVSSVTKRDAITSASGGSTGQDLYYNSVGGTISGTVTYNGKPVIMATVFLADLLGNFVGLACTIDAAGTYHLYNVPAGDYIASAWHPDCGESSNFPVTGVTDNGTVTTNIVIQ